MLSLRYLLQSLFFFLFQATILSAYFEDQPKFVADVETGYRWDYIIQSIQIVDSAGILPYSSAEYQFKDLSSAQFGVRGFAEYCSFITKGYAHYGCVVNGDFDVDRVLVGEKELGFTLDASAGIGYSFCVCDCFSVVPLIGYSWDKQHLRITHLRSKIPVIDPNNLVRAKWDSRWYGPWVGFDIFYDATEWCRDMYFTTGYEFHYGRALTKLHQDLIIPEDSHYSYKTGFKNMMGHVFRWDSRVRVCGDWFAGLNMIYSYWGNAHNSRSTFIENTDSGLAPTERQEVYKLSWYAYAVLLNFSTVF